MLFDYWVKYKRPIVFIGTTLAVLLIGWGIFYNFVIFHITSISPNPNGASYLTPRLIIGFNKDLVGESVKVTLDNKDLVTSVDGHKLTITLPGDLTGNKTYDITIKAISSKSGDTMKDRKISLRTVLNSDSLSEADKKLILDQQQANKSSLVNDPIFTYVPHSTLDYSIEGIVNNAGTEFKKITLKISINLTAADVKINRDSAIKQYQAEAMNYLNSLKDIDISTYSIEVSVIEPTL